MARHDSRAILLGGLEDILGDGEDAAVRGGGGGCITMFEGNYCRCKISVPICKDFHVGGYLQAAVQYSLLLSEYMGINLESYAVMTYANTTIVGWRRLPDPRMVVVVVRFLMSLIRQLVMMDLVDPKDCSQRQHEGLRD